MKSEMAYWAEVGDNRFGPILKELVEALEDCDDPVKLSKIANRLKFLSSAIHTHAHYATARKTSGKPGADNGG